jgi:hypothetical protein
VAAAYNVTVDQGADYYLTLTYNSPAGTPINLTGYTSSLQVRQNPSDINSYLTLTTANGGIVITGSTGTVAVHASAAQTTAIGAGYYYYDIKLTSSVGIVTRLTQGQFTVNASITIV